MLGGSRRVFSFRFRFSVLGFLSFSHHSTWDSIHTRTRTLSPSSPGLPKLSLELSLLCSSLVYKLICLPSLSLSLQRALTLAHLA